MITYEVNTLKGNIDFDKDYRVDLLTNEILSLVAPYPVNSLIEENGTKIVGNNLDMKITISDTKIELDCCDFKQAYFEELILDIINILDDNNYNVTNMNVDFTADGRENNTDQTVKYTL